MIPTTVSSSPTTVTSSICISGNTSNNNQQSSSSVIIGLASLILEGRGIADEEVQAKTQRHTKLGVAELLLQNADIVGSGGGVSGGGGGGGSNNGRQSPMPSTSKAATNSVINITTNPHAFGCATACYSYDTHHSSPSNSLAESTHQRWTQKLCQLRQASPGAGLSSVYGQNVAIRAQSTKDEPEVLALLSDCQTQRHEYEFLNRDLLNRHGTNAAVASAVSASPSSASGTDNFLLSLQSLATTCLRGSSPSADTACHYTNQLNQHIPVVGIAATSSKYNYRATPPRFPSPYIADTPGSASSSGSCIQSPKHMWSPIINDTVCTAINNQKDKYIQQSSGRLTAATVPSSAIEDLSNTTKGAIYPKQGPHCDQFLRKVGLSTQSQTAETEDHFCDMTILNITCSRWRAHCLRMEAIIARGDPVCIEVYLGPVGNKILLEQWVITKKEKVPPPTMTLTSLCSAIRSQLYFSQISAWCDLIKKSDKSIYYTGRLIFPTPTGAAGDLATLAAMNSTNISVTPGTSPTSTTSSLHDLSHPMLKPRLNIFYRVKQYDSTASFNSKPNVHNFPNVNVSENCSISVCLKSLPRINGGIPKISLTVPATTECSSTSAANVGNIVNRSATKTKTKTTTSTATATATITTTAATCDVINCDNKDVKVANSTKAMEQVVATKESQSASSKQKCTFYIGDNNVSIDEVECACNNDNDNDIDSDAGKPGGDSTNSISSNVSLSHREKQLMKYRKRMLKRDKKQRKPVVYKSDNSMDLTDNQKHNNKNNEKFIYQPMEECEKESSNELTSLAKTTVTRGNNNVQMISTGTQTSMTCCQQCGSEKSFVCLNCKGMYDVGNDSLSELDEMDSCSSISSSDIIHTPRNQAELLLQAIQRTPKAAKNKKQMRSKAAMSTAMNSTRTTTAGNTAILLSPILQNNNHLSVTPITSGSNCHVCKRQKTQHNFSARSEESGDDTELIADDGDDEDGDGRGDTGDKIEYTTLKEEEDESDIMEEEILLTTTKITSFENTTTKKSAYLVLQERDEDNQKKQTHGRDAVVVMVDTVSAAEKQFKTPTSEQQQKSHKKEQNPTKKPSMLQITRSYNNESSDNYHECTPPSHTRLFTRKGLPKVNLTPIFCDPAATIKASLTSPVPICCPTAETAFCFDVPTVNGTSKTPTNTTNHIAGDIPVQKSFSAPTLPNSPSLSPRFAKQAAIYKRRSRHLSDRSDRSSLGSDEQFSDEEVESAIYSPATSPMKNRIRMAAMFGRAPLLGNLEEALLQKRLMPKTEVLGFKVLLGASGLFCPPQLTIPATAYFYELHGESLSTPYLCEIRLPRKGYTVPRYGTVQATLLNPMGTVVRMFVIPYDMRDMPTMHQTFIRQRVLADSSVSNLLAESNANNNNIDINNCNNKNSTDGVNNSNINYSLSPNGGLHSHSNLGHFISAENMKRLRYSIHLRFQTSRSGRLMLHTDIRLLISRRTDCDTAAAHAKGVLEAPNELITDTVMPMNPKYSARQESSNKI